MTLRELVKRVIWPYRRHKSRTVRYAFPLLFIIAALLGANVIDSNTDSFITVEASQQAVRAGDSFKIQIYASANTPVNAVDVQLAFPENQVKITGIDTGESVITLWTEEPFVDGNKVILRGGTFRKGFIGKHLIATINAEAIESGSALFKITNKTFLAGDGSGNEVAVADTDTDSIQLYIANTLGVITLPSTNPGSIGAEVTLRIITDIDGDGDVSLKDVSRFLAAWDTKTEIFDFNGDGKMTFRDFAIILADVFTR